MKVAKLLGFYFFLAHNCILHVNREELAMSAQKESIIFVTTGYVTLLDAASIIDHTETPYKSINLTYIVVIEMICEFDMELYASIYVCIIYIVLGSTLYTTDLGVNTISLFAMLKARSVEDGSLCPNICRDIS